MSRKDSIKEQIGTLRVFAILFLTSIFGVLGYAVANLENLTLTKVFIGIVILISLASVFVLVLIAHNKRLRELEEIEWLMD